MEERTQMGGAQPAMQQQGETARRPETKQAQAGNPARAAATPQAGSAQAAGQQSGQQSGTQFTDWASI